MAYEIGTATGHIDLVNKFNTFVTTTVPLADRWAINRNVTDGTTGERELLWQLPGLSGIEEIFVGMYSYKSVSSDYYNIAVAGHTGYVAGNTFATQPGTSIASGVPLWNNSIPYWFVANGQRAIVFAKIENVYESFYIGKYLPYATPTQYPYPLCIGGMLTSASATRYSETTHTSWFKGNRVNFTMRFVDGLWKNPQLFPFQLASNYRNTNSDKTVATGYYGLHPLTLADASNIYGELDGIYLISGFNNAAENTISIGGITYVVLRDVWRTGIKDYIALRLS